MQQKINLINSLIIKELNRTFTKKQNIMTSENYRRILKAEYHFQELTIEDFDNTLMHFAKLYHKEQLNKICK